LSDNSKSCGKEGILGLHIEKEGKYLLLAVIVGQPVFSAGIVIATIVFHAHIR